MESVVQTRERVAWVDIAKGLTMLCIVFGHLMVDTFTQSLVYAFHVPTFFLLSGYCFNGNLPFLKFVSKKIKRIMIPYFTFGLLAIVIYLLYGRLTHTETQTVAQCFLGLIIGNGKSDMMEFNKHIWFLPCLFVMTVIFYGVSRLVDRIVSRTKCSAAAAYAVLTVVLFAAAFPAFGWHTKWYLPWGTETALRFLSLYSLGFCLSRQKIAHVSFRKEPLKASVLVIMAAACAVVLYWAARKNYLMNLVNGHFMVWYMGDKFGNKYYYWLSALSGIAVVLIISLLLPESKLLIAAGKKTMPVLLLQRYPIMVLRLILDRFSWQSEPLAAAVMLLLSVLVMAACIVADSVIRRFFPFMYGCRYPKKKSAEPKA